MIETNEFLTRYISSTDPANSLHFHGMMIADRVERYIFERTYNNLRTKDQMNQSGKVENENVENWRYTCFVRRALSSLSIVVSSEHP